MKVYQLESQISSKINEFIYSHPLSNIFQTSEMYETYKKTNNYEPVFIVARENNEIYGTLLAVIQKEHSGFLGKFSSRSIIWGGPLVKDNDLDVLDYILKEFNKIVKKKSIYSQLRNMWEFSKEEKKIFTKHGFMYEDHLDIIHHLETEPGKQLQNMSKGRRKNIRRAGRYGVIFKEINTKEKIKEALSIIKSLYEFKKIPFPDETLFTNALKYLYPKNMVRFFVAEYEDEIIGARFVFCFNDLIYDWYAACKPDFLSKYPNDFLPYKVMEWGHEKGYKTFDFGGAGKPDKPYGVRDYKLKFGGELVNWGRFERVNKPTLLKIGKFAFKIYQLVK